jgi:putative hydroxymethylpyrimidine transport system permease protein
MERLGSTVKRLLNRFLSVYFLLALILLWEWIVGRLQIPNYMLPAPSVILQTLINRFPLLMQHARITMYEAVVGMMGAVVVALLLAVTIHKIRIFRKLLYPVFVISQTVPIIALAPLMMIWFGYGTLPKILIVILVCFFPIVINLTEGLDGVDPDLIDLMRVMGASSGRIFFSVELPSALPSAFAGLRIAATYSIMGAVIGEWVGGNLGLGVFMIRAMNSYSTPSLFAAIVLVVLLSIGMFKLVDAAAWLMMPWQRTRSEIEET